MHVLENFSRENDTNLPLRPTKLAQAELFLTVIQKSHRQMLTTPERQAGQVCGMSKFTDQIIGGSIKNHL